MEQRNHAIDNLRGILTICVVLGHVIFGLERCIYKSNICTLSNRLFV